MNTFKDIIVPCLTLLVAIATLFATIYISRKIAWESYYNELNREYRSLEFGKAMQGIILFFVNDCNKDISKIQREYELKYLQQVSRTNSMNLSAEDTLHYQRRMLAQFFVDLEKCANIPSYYIGKKRVQNDYTSGTKDLVRILFFMGIAIENSSILFQDISCDERVPKSQRIKGQNKHLSHMYEILKESKEYME